MVAAIAPTAATAQQAEDDDRGGDHLVVVRQTPWVSPGGTFAIRLRVEDPPRDAQLRVGLHGRVRTRSEFNRSLEGRGLRARLGPRQDADLADLEQLAGGVIERRIPTGSLTGEEPIVTLGPDAEGVYPVLIELLDGDGDPVDRIVTHLVRLPDPNPNEHPLGAVIVVPLHAPPSHVGPGDIDVGTLAPLQVTVEALLARPGIPVTVLPTPEAVGGAAASDPAARERLVTATEGRPVLAETWVRLRADAWSAGGLGRELAAQRRAGRAAVANVLGRQPTDDVAVLPDDGGVDTVAAAVAGGAEVVIVPQSDLTPLDGTRFPLTVTRPFLVPADDGDDPDLVTALLADTDLRRHHGATNNPVLAAHHLLADLAVLALDAPVSPRVAVAVLDDDAAIDRAFLGTILAALDHPERAGAAPLVVATTVDEAVATVAPLGAAGGVDRDDPLVRSFVDDLDPPVGVAALRDDLRAAAADLGSYRSVFGADDDLGGDVEELNLTAAAASLSARERRALLTAGLQRLRAELAAIRPPPRQRVTLTAREGQVQLVLTKLTDRPAEVTVELRGDRLEFPDHPDGRLLVALDGETTRVDLDVRARSSGDAPLDLRLTTPDGRIELGRARVTVRTTAVSGVGVVLMGAALLFLIVWWTRTILRERGVARRHPAHAR